MGLGGTWGWGAWEVGLGEHGEHGRWGWGSMGGGARWEHGGGAGVDGSMGRVGGSMGGWGWGGWGGGGAGVGGSMGEGLGCMTCGGGGAMGWYMRVWHVLYTHEGRSLCVFTSQTEPQVQLWLQSLYTTPLVAYSCCFIPGST